MKSRYITTFLSFIIIFIFLGTFSLSYAAEPPTYNTLALPKTGSVSFRIDSLGGLVIDVFRYVVAFSAALAVFMIILGGVQYMSTDSWTGHRDGIERIKQALIGLMLVILTYLILQTINPKIVDISFLGAVSTRPVDRTQEQVTKWCAAIFDNTNKNYFGAFLDFDCNKQSSSDCNSQTIPWYTGTGNASKWCVALFDNTSKNTFGEFVDFDCQKASQNDCNTQTIPWYTGTGNASKWCVALFDNASKETYRKFVDFDCQKVSHNDCTKQTIPWYTTEGNASKWCVAQFVNGKFHDFDCSQPTKQGCETHAVRAALNAGATVSGTMRYPDGTTFAFNGCFPKYAVEGNIKYPDGHTSAVGGCFSKYATTGNIPGVGQVGGCFTETRADEFRSKIK